MEDRLDILERRLEAAERRAGLAERRFQRLAGSLVVAALSLGVLGLWQGAAIAQAAKSKPMKVTKLTAPMQVVDQRGAILMMVENAKPGPRLQLFGSVGRPIAELAMTEQGGGKVTLFDRAGKPGFTQPLPRK
ncbi:MAG: hypothetical protein ACO1SX_21695 [Actinomycetota bacterium]